LGVVFGLLSLTRPSAILLPALFSVVILTKLRKSFLRAAAVVLTMITGVLLVVMPWTIRNWEIHRRVVLVSTNGGLNLYQAFNPEGGRMFGLVPRDPVIGEASTIENEADRDSFLARNALVSVAGSPLRALHLTVIRLLFYWGFFDWEFEDGGKFNGMFAFLLPFAVLGVIRKFSSTEGVQIIVMVITAFTLTVLFSQGAVRYRLPTDGLMFVPASHGLSLIYHEMKRNRAICLCVASFGVVNAALTLIPGMAKEILRDAAHALGLW
jgi:hypothetical protein